MKVVFSGVSNALIAIISRSIAKGLGNSQYLNGNNKTCWYQHINTNQSIEIKNSTITVEGERCALWGDHHREAMHTLSISGVEPSEYRTSDSRLRWDETLTGYMEGQRASYDEALRYCREKKLNPTYFYALGGAIADALRLQQYPLRARAEMPFKQLERAREVLALL